MWQQLLLYLIALKLPTVSGYLPYDLPGGPKAASFDIHMKMGREKDPQDGDLVIGQGPLNRNSGKNNKPIAVIPPGGDRRVPLGNGSGVLDRASSLADALPGSIDPVLALKAALKQLKKGQSDSMARLNDVYLACGKKGDDKAVQECLTSDQALVVKARLRNFNETIGLVEGMDGEARSISKDLKGAGEEMKSATLQEGEAKVILKSEAFSDKEAWRQIERAKSIDQKEELKEKSLKMYVGKIKDDKQAADDANTYSLLTHEEFHVRLNGIVKGITVGDQLAKDIFDRTGSILEAARIREASASKMSERADSLINTTSAWSELHQQHADERLETLKRREQAKNKTVTDADNKQLEKLRELDEDALNKIVQKKNGESHIGGLW